MKNWQSTLIGIFVGVILTSGMFLTLRTPQQAILLPTSTPTNLVIQMAGEVRNPGIYTLPANSRVSDAITSAGGLTDQADRSAVNLATRLKDGEKLIILRPTPTAAPVTETGGSTPTPQHTKTGPTPTATVTFPIDLNTATLDQLDALPGIGPTRAQDILKYREEHQSFKRIEDLLQIPGIGQTTFNRLKLLVTVEPTP